MEDGKPDRATCRTEEEKSTMAYCNEGNAKSSRAELRRKNDGPSMALFAASVEHSKLVAPVALRALTVKALPADWPRKLQTMKGLAKLEAKTGKLAHEKLCNGMGVAEPNRAELFDKAENSEWEQLRAEAAGAEQEKLLRLAPTAPSEKGIVKIAANHISQIRRLARLSWLKQSFEEARAADPTRAEDRKKSDGSGLAELGADATESRNSSVCEKPEASTAEPSWAKLWSSINGPSPWLPGASNGDAKRQMPKTSTEGSAWANLRRDNRESKELHLSAETAKLTREKLRGDKDGPALKPPRTSEERSSRERPQAEVAEATLASFRGNNRSYAVAAKIHSPQIRKQALPSRIVRKNAQAPMVELPGTDGDESEHANPEADAEDASLEGKGRHNAIQYAEPEGKHSKLRCTELSTGADAPAQLEDLDDIELPVAAALSTLEVEPGRAMPRTAAELDRHEELRSGTEKPGCANWKAKAAELEQAEQSRSMRGCAEEASFLNQLHSTPVVTLSMWLNPEAKSGEPEWPRDCNEAETPGCAEDKAETARPEQA
ncbi:hypothetical protein AK812_SmicGene24310 [Symbiodinium microadriaticum]|uniref:Uncharacterized protein n=1 Tax=Symbiodinium microadriaticum TaxID=2951 RepID=A0A1Q9DF71_SYMMI|nr:hypothetical protein AK812_SmicGene24310 [Symbiodinium microadriaticum]CAE7789303.1 unnamed protein product [Symbiodinium microadriaticum]